MTSIEALINLVHCKSETKCKECKHKYRCTMERDYNIIKQSLERIEQLEKENQELKTKGKELVKDVRKAIDVAKKLKKAIELLKTKPFVLNLGLEIFKWDEFEQCYIYEEESVEEDMYGETYLNFTTYTLTKEEYDLLKEVLGE